MAGLLGDLNDPENAATWQMVAGLLGGGNFGEQLGRGLSGYQQTKLSAQKLELEKLQEQRARQMQQMQLRAMQDYMGPQQGAQQIGQGLPPVGQQMPQGQQMQPQGQPMQGQPQGMQGQMPQQPMQGQPGEQELRKLSALAIAGVPGAKELFEIYKYKTSPQAIPAGYVRDPATNQIRYLGDPTKGLAVDGNGTIQQMPGAANIAALAGQQADATERAKATYDLTSVQRSDGTSQQIPRLQAAQMLGGQPGVGDFGGYGRGLDLSRVSPQQLAQMAQDDPSALAAGINRFKASQQPQLGVSISPAEQERAKIIASGQANQVVEDSKKADQFKDFGSQINLARTLLQAGPTGSSAGALVDSGLGVFGISPTSANLAKKLETTAGWMIQNIPKAPGAQSDAELRDYKIAAGIVGDKTVPVAQRMAALDTVENLKNMWEQRKATGQPAPQDQPKSFSDYGYKSQNDVLNDARNTILRNPASKPEVERRLKLMGLSLGGM